jgi:hypothetical protein
VVSVLATAATLAGLLGQGSGQHVAFRTLRGESVMLQGHGLYHYDSVSFAAQGIDVNHLPACFSPGLPRRSISAFLYLIGSFLSLAWLGRIVPPLFADRPPIGLESYSTLVIQTLDLGIIYQCRSCQQLCCGSSAPRGICSRP